MVPSPCPRLARGFFLLALAASGSLAAAPYRPADDGAVLERLPPGAPSGAARSRPRDPARAAAVAQAYIERARRDGDPRFLGYAEGLLRPWQGDAAAPPAVRLLHATLLQSRHRFADALRELDALLAAQPDDAQAWLTRAAVLRVQGRPAEARAACDELRGRAAPAVVLVCAEAARGLSGQLRSAAVALDALAPGLARAPAGVRAWHAAERADMAERLGDDARALALYRDALAATGGDAATRAALADLLLRLQRPREVLALSRESPPADGLRLRAALAWRALGEPRPELEAELQATFDAARDRGDPPHLREEARLALDGAGDAARALRLARENWREQREPADALLLAAAARRAGDARVLAELAAWQRDTGLEDARLGPLP